MDQQVKNILNSLGHDVEYYRSKYMNDTNQQNDAVSTIQMDSGKMINGSNDSNYRELCRDKHDDRLCICNECHGFGIVKEVYNHIIHESNCDNCEAAGIMWNENGSLVPLSQRPQTTRN